MALADTSPPWLRSLADAAAVVLLLELIVLLVIVTALMVALWYGANWLRKHVVPVLNVTVPRARQALDVANAGTEQVTRGVAEVYGIRKALETGLQVMLHGSGSGRQAAAALETSGAAGNLRVAEADGGAAAATSQLPA